MKRDILYELTGGEIFEACIAYIKLKYPNDTERDYSCSNLQSNSVQITARERPGNKDE